ncbi:MAG: hypothetical protein PHQ35_09600 [Phycisphaerae bacterium]|nr:hypothetical protein [Phycisphaerae bacterium]MDD5239970.1 hypothetical protein [Candidatus Nanoarchaeia archaeon]
MLKYRGTYRVMYEVDKTGKACEFTFIPCLIKRGSNICRHSDTVLNVYITSSKIINRLLKEYPDLFRPFQTSNGEGTLLFNEADIEKAAEILRPKVLGKGMNPKPKRQVTLSDERKKELSDRMRSMRGNIKNIGEKQGKTG